MAATPGTISTSGIEPGRIIRSAHVLRIIEALDGTETNDIYISGSLITTGSVGITGSIDVIGNITGSAFTGSFTGDGSGLTGVTGEWDGTHDGNAEITGSFNVSGSTGLTGSLDVSGSVTLSGSFSGSFEGDGTNLTGITAEWDGTHDGNAEITGSLFISGTQVDFTEVTDGVSGSFSGSFEGDGSGLTGLPAQNSGSFSGSFEGDGSGLTGIIGEWDGSLDGDAQITGSLFISGTQVDFTEVTDGVSGSFSGSFVGDGSLLTGLPTQNSGSFSGSFEGDGSGLTGLPAQNSGSFSGSFEGNGSNLTSIKATQTNLQETLLVNQNVGGISVGETFSVGTDVEDILRQILIQFIPSTISGIQLRNGGSNISISVREVNSGITTDEFTITVSENDPNLLTPINLSLTASGATTGNFENYYGTSLSVGTNDITISPDEVLNVDSIPSANSANITITARAEDPTDSSVLSTSRTYSYVYPFYYGSSITDLSLATGTALETANLNKLVATKGTKQLTMAATSQYLYFAYPSRYGNLADIKDANNSSQLPNYTKHTRTINGGNGWSNVEYFIYQSNTTTSIISQTYTISF